MNFQPNVPYQASVGVSGHFRRPGLSQGNLFDDSFVKSQDSIATQPQHFLLAQSASTMSSNVPSIPERRKSRKKWFNQLNLVRGRRLSSKKSHSKVMISKDDFKGSNQVTDSFLSNEELLRDDVNAETMDKHIQAMCDETKTIIFKILDDFRNRMMDLRKAYADIKSVTDKSSVGDSTKNGVLIMDKKLLSEDECVLSSFPFYLDQIKDILSNVFSVTSLSYVIIGVESKNQCNEMVWKDIFGPLGSSILASLENEMRTSLKGRNQILQKKVSDLSHEINNIRTKVLNHTFSVFGSPVPFPLPQSFSAQHFATVEMNDQQLHAASLSEAANWVLDMSRRVEDNGFSLKTTEEQLEVLSEKLRGQWGSVALVERWVQDSVRWQWLDIYGRQKYIDQHTNLESTIKEKQATFEKNLDKRLCELWMHCVETLHYDELNYRDEIARDVVWFQMNRDKMRLKFNYESCVMQGEDYISYLLRALGKTSSVGVGGSSEVDKGMGAYSFMKPFWRSGKKKSNSFYTSPDRPASAVSFAETLNEISPHEKELDNMRVSLETLQKKLDEGGESKAKEIELQQKLKDELQRGEEMKKSYLGLCEEIKHLEISSKTLEHDLKHLKREIEYQEAQLGQKKGISSYAKSLLKSKETVKTLQGKLDSIAEKVKELEESGEKKEAYFKTTHRQQDNTFLKENEMKAELSAMAGFRRKKLAKSVSFLTKFSKALNARKKKSKFSKRELINELEKGDRLLRPGKASTFGVPRNRREDSGQWDDITLGDLSLDSARESQHVHQEITSTTSDQGDKMECSPEKVASSYYSSVEGLNSGTAYSRAESYESRALSSPSKGLSALNHQQSFNTSHIALSDDDFYETMGAYPLVKINVLSPSKEPLNGSSTELVPADYVPWNTRPMALRLRNGLPEHSSCVSRELKMKKFSSNETIYSPRHDGEEEEKGVEMDKVNILYLITKGKVKILDDKDNVLERLTRGCPLLDVAFQKQMHSCVSVVAESDVTLTYLTHERFLFLCKELRQNTVRSILHHCQSSGSPFAQAALEIQKRLAVSMSVRYFFPMENIRLIKSQGTQRHVDLVLQGSCNLLVHSGMHAKDKKHVITKCSTGKFFCASLLASMLELELLVSTSSSHPVSIASLSLEKCEELLPKTFDLRTRLLSLPLSRDVLSKTETSKDQHQSDSLVVGKMQRKKRQSKKSISKVSKGLSKLITRKRKNFTVVVRGDSRRFIDCIMTERWISTKKHYCSVCECWISGHPMNVAHHTMSESHQAKSQKALHMMHQKERQRKIDQGCLAAEIQRMEMAGCQAFLKKDVYGTNEKRDAQRLKSLAQKEEKKQSETLLHPASVPAVGTISAGPKIQITVQPYPVKEKDSPEVYVPQEKPETSGWIASFDPLTNAPFYYNPMTGQSSRVNPSTISKVVTPSSAPLFSTSNEAYAQKVISDLLPTVNEMTDSYKEFLLSTQKTQDGREDSWGGSKPPEAPHGQDEISKRIGHLPKYLANKLRSRLETLGSKTSRVTTESPLDKTGLPDGKITPEVSSASCSQSSMEPLVSAQENSGKLDSCPSANLPPQFIPAPAYEGTKSGYIFTTCSGITGYFWDSPHLAFDHLSRSDSGKAIVDDKVFSQATQTKKSNVPQEGEWVDVPAEESKFGDCVKRKVVTAPLPETRLEYEVAKSVSERSDTKTIAALKEDAEASGHLSFQDLKRVEKIVFEQPPVDSSNALDPSRGSNEIQFQKRRLKNSNHLRHLKKRAFQDAKT